MFPAFRKGFLGRQSQSRKPSKQQQQHRKAQENEDAVDSRVEEEKRGIRISNGKIVCGHTNCRKYVALIDQTHRTCRCGLVLCLCHLHAHECKYDFRGNEKKSLREKMISK